MRTDQGYFEEEKLGKSYDVKLIRRLYPFTKTYWKWLLCSVLLMLIITVFDLSLPYITKIAIDRYIVPGIETLSSDNNKERFYHVDISKKENREIVNKYKNLFNVNGKTALISYDILRQLDKKDIHILRKDDLNGVSILALILIIVVVMNFFINFIHVIIMEYTGQMIMHDLRLELFSHIQSLSISFYSRNPVGRLLTRVTNDVQNMHEMFTSVINFGFKDIFLLIGITIVLISTDFKLALFTFTVIPFVVLAALYFSKVARGAFRILRVKMAEINTMFSETIGGIKVIQLFRQEESNYQKFKKLNHENYVAGIKQIHVFAVFMPVIELLGAVSLAIVIMYGGGNVISEKFTLGSLVVFISYMKMFFRPLRDIAEKYNIMQNALASAERIFLILDNKDKLQQPLSSPEVNEIKKIKEFEFDDVSFSYFPGEYVLKNISFKVNAGETIAVVGPTGSGKTTLINLIVRFYDTVSGSVLINGSNIKNFHTSDIRSKMALVMQDPFLFSETIRDNVLHGNSNYSEKNLDQILINSNCKQFVERLPDASDTVLSEGGSSLSSGERQLISIARAFAGNPDLIILDEATSYIDTETEIKIQEVLEKLMVNRTSIIIAHRLSTVKNADRIIVLNKGEIIETGSYSELMGKEGFFYKLNLIQG
ncbi:MAG: ABC transporter ATP-binding protein [Desulfobacterales bacterium]|jgi:ATP-binding cassette, subfamily B, multidrug efflux pump|nr:ABC transporter ATP-binding protein [Desulfobacteraceae bacterium]MBT7085452.1 ABC transporter ATP-binding protein [Desulfobacterales bacterium]MBT7697529.1 ABC transporter ATP-binding protein [Desulfobacterales bacterium]